MPRIDRQHERRWKLATMLGYLGSGLLIASGCRTDAARRAIVSEQLSPCATATVDTANWRRVTALDGRISLLLPPSITASRFPNPTRRSVEWLEAAGPRGMRVTAILDSTPIPVGDMNGTLKDYRRCRLEPLQSSAVVTTYWSDEIEEPGQVVIGEVPLGVGEFITIRTRAPHAGTMDVQRTIVQSLRVAR